MSTLSTRRNLWLPTLLLAVVAIPTPGCSSSDDTMTGPIDYSVVYTVATETILAGTAQIDRVVYVDEMGQDVEVTQFGVPAQWSQSVTMRSGDAIALNAQATVANGRMVLQISVFGSSGPPFARTNSSMPFSTGTFTASIPRETLP